MIAHKSPRIDAQGIGSTKTGEAFKKIVPISFVAEYRYSGNAPAHNMMQGTGCIRSWLSWHTKDISLCYYVVKLFWNQCYISKYQRRTG